MSTCMPRQRPHATATPRTMSRRTSTPRSEPDGPTGRRLSHVDASGRLRMVNVSAKRVTAREAVARGRVFMHHETLGLIRSGTAPKGDVLAVAHVAGVMAAKRTSDIIPLAHPLPIDGIDLSFTLDEEGSSVCIEARVSTRARTGVEMEALTAVTVAALTLYDMLKAVDRGMVMGEFALWEKRGGKSGVYRRRT
jgi:cyclic pyranopterin monophosphate synthase